MSNINNHGVDMNNIELISCVQELSVDKAATIQGGAALELYEDSNFRKPIFFTDSSYSYVGNPSNDKISSIRINKGTWEFYADRDFKGKKTTLGVGAYFNASNLNVGNDTISSFRRIK